MLQKIERWYREATELHGDDWPSVQTYVVEKIATINSADHMMLLAQLRTLLGNKDETLH